MLFPFHLSFSAFYVFCFSHTLGKLLRLKFCFPQYFGKTSRYMPKRMWFLQEKLIFRRFLLFTPSVWSWKPSPWSIVTETLTWYKCNKILNEKEFGAFLPFPPTKVNRKRIHLSTNCNLSLSFLSSFISDWVYLFKIIMSRRNLFFPESKSMRPTTLDIKNYDSFL